MNDESSGPGRPAGVSGLSTQDSQGSQLLSRIRCRVDLRVGLGDLAFLVDDVGDAAGVLVLGGVGGTVGETDLAFGVAEQGEGEVELFGEAAVRFDGIEADAQDLRVLGLELHVEVPEPGTLTRSTRGVGLRIEPEHDFLAAPVGELHAIAVVIDDVEIGSGLAGLKHFRFSSQQGAQDTAEGHGEHCSRRVDESTSRREYSLDDLTTRRLDDWNARYRAGDDINTDPAEVLVDAARDLVPGRALDLACGAGRNAVWLASRGWEVVALDGASEAIRILREHDARVDARIVDLESGAPLPFADESFDLVAILFYLHRPLFAEAKRVVKRGGIVVSAIRMRGINPRFCIAQGELAKEFAGFETLHASEGEIAELVARR